VEEDEQACQDGWQDEVLCVGRRKQEPRARREHGEGGGDDNGDAPIEQPDGDQEYENDRQGVGDEQPKVNAGGRPPKTASISA
jgi:hypothetical protein